MFYKNSTLISALTPAPSIVGFANEQIKFLSKVTTRYVGFEWIQDLHRLFSAQPVHRDHEWKHWDLESRGLRKREKACIHKVETSVVSVILWVYFWAPHARVASEQGPIGVPKVIPSKMELNLFYIFQLVSIFVDQNRHIPFPNQVH